MANKAEHQSKWLSNRQFLATVGQAHPDWMATVIFYTALHAIETLFAHDGTRVFPGHTERNQTLKTVNRYKNLWMHYRPLYDAARTARYDPIPSTWMTAPDIKAHLVKHLYAIEKSVQKLAGLSLQLDPVW